MLLLATLTHARTPHKAHRGQQQQLIASAAMTAPSSSLSPTCVLLLLLVLLLAPLPTPRAFYLAAIGRRSVQQQQQQQRRQQQPSPSLESAPTSRQVASVERAPRRARSVHGVRCVPKSSLLGDARADWPNLLPSL